MMEKLERKRKRIRAARTARVDDGKTGEKRKRIRVARKAKVVYRGLVLDVGFSPLALDIMRLLILLGLLLF